MTKKQIAKLIGAIGVIASPFILKLCADHNIIITQDQLQAITDAIADIFAE